MHPVRQQDAEKIYCQPLSLAADRLRQTIVDLRVRATPKIRDISKPLIRRVPILLKMYQSYPLYKDRHETASFLYPLRINLLKYGESEGLPKAKYLPQKLQNSGQRLLCA